MLCMNQLENQGECAISAFFINRLAPHRETRNQVANPLSWHSAPKRVQAFECPSYAFSWVV